MGKAADRGPIRWRTTQFGRRWAAVANRFLVDAFLQAHAKAPEKIVFDLEPSPSARVFPSTATRTSSIRPARAGTASDEWPRSSIRVDKPNARFVVTSLPIEDVAAQPLYENDYCGRDEMENRIKEQKSFLFSDRRPAATMYANQLRLWFSSVAADSCAGDQYVRSRVFAHFLQLRVSLHCKTCTEACTALVPLASASVTLGQSPFPTGSAAISQAS